jgi:hypothetical protein
MTVMVEIPDASEMPKTIEIGEHAETRTRSVVSEMTRDVVIVIRGVAEVAEAADHMNLQRMTG